MYKSLPSGPGEPCRSSSSRKYKSRGRGGRQEKQGPLKQREQISVDTQRLRQHCRACMGLHLSSACILWLSVYMRFPIV